MDNLDVGQLYPGAWAGGSAVLSCKCRNPVPLSGVEAVPTARSAQQLAGMRSPSRPKHRLPPSGPVAAFGPSVTAGTCVVS